MKLFSVINQFLQNLVEIFCLIFKRQGVAIAVTVLGFTSLARAGEFFPQRLESGFILGWNVSARESTGQHRNNESNNPNANCNIWTHEDLVFLVYGCIFTFFTCAFITGFPGIVIGINCWLKNRRDRITDKADQERRAKIWEELLKPEYPCGPDALKNRKGI
jgi:hypothetical protein